MTFKFEDRYRRDMPQTVGETDSSFDRANYCEWLEKKLEIAELHLVSLVKADYCDCGCTAVPSDAWKAAEEMAGVYGRD